MGWGLRLNHCTICHLAFPVRPVSHTWIIVTVPAAIVSTKVNFYQFTRLFWLGKAIHELYKQNQLHPLQAPQLFSGRVFSSEWIYRLGVISSLAPNSKALQVPVVDSDSLAPVRAVGILKWWIWGIGILNMIIGSVDILIGSVGILNGEFDSWSYKFSPLVFWKGVIGACWYFDMVCWYFDFISILNIGFWTLDFERWYFEPLPI